MPKMGCPPDVASETAAGPIPPNVDSSLANLEGYRLISMNEISWIDAIRAHVTPASFGFLESPASNWRTDKWRRAWRFGIKNIKGHDLNSMQIWTGYVCLCVFVPYWKGLACYNYDVPSKDIKSRSKKSWTFMGMVGPGIVDACKSISIYYLDIRF